MKSAFNRKVVLGVFVLVIVSLGCNLTRTGEPTPTASNTTTINGPGGMILTLEGNALTDTSEIQLDSLGSGEVVWENSPFQAASEEYLVDFGAGEQVGGITLTVPLASTSAGRGVMASPRAEPISSFVYAAWAYPDNSIPSLVGVITDTMQVTFPIIGAGKYQVLRIPSSAALSEMFDVKDPLSAPSYPQLQTGWCSTTALTDLAGFHEGAWPVGGRGSVWGESSNWFLAGKSGQATDIGFFFHWLLEGGGYSTPEDVREDFQNGNAMVIIWNWQANWIDPNVNSFYRGSYVAQLEQYAQELFDFFQAYVETNLWGEYGPRRPVAWGSALAGHSRLITGSDGTKLFYNDPASGSWNQTKSWVTYRQEVLSSLYGGTAQETEVIDTTIFLADPRPLSQRRAVLWLWEKTDSQNGSIILRRGSAGDPAAYWHWDGAAGHEYGYYFEDLMGDMPVDDIFGAQFKAFTTDDRIEYGYSIRSISEGIYDYVVTTELFTSGGGKNVILLPDQTATVDGGGRVDIFPAGSFPIVDLEPYLYFLKFTLSQGGIVQDVKYVYFRTAPNEVIHASWSVVLRSAFCRDAPSQNSRVLTTVEAGQEIRLLGLDSGRSWGKFEVPLGSDTIQCWVGLSMVDTRGNQDVPIIEFPTPTATVTTSPCSQYTSAQTCAQHPDECTWNPFVRPQVCQAK